MNPPAIKAGHLAYGLLGLPLAMAALPVYVNIPVFYALHLDMGLVQLGWVLFAARLIDTVQDPLLGLVVDRLAGALNRWLIAAAVIFALAFAGLWLPPDGALASVVWLGATLVLVYGAHSFLSISYLAWGASLDGAATRAQVLLGPAAWREAAGLIGILLASAIPAAVMAGDPARVAGAMAWYSAGFALLLIVALLVLLCRAPAWQRSAPEEARWPAVLHAVRANQGFKQLLPPYLLNALSVSLPATLVLFYIRDQLQAPAQGAIFLVAYFAAAMCGLPLWIRLAKHSGTARTWRAGMLLAVGAFAGAALLGPGDTTSYMAVCLVAGAALGADLALPPVLFAQAIGGRPGKGIYYSFYTLIGKLALACAGLSLPLLASLGYRPGAGPSMALVAIYAGLPCVLKLAAFFALKEDM